MERSGLSGKISSSFSSSNFKIPNSDSEDSSKKKEIHDLRLKDAIVRQEMMKLDKEAKTMLAKKEEIKSEIARMEQKLKQEDRLLQAQEEDLVNSKTKLSIKKKPKNSEKLLRELERTRQGIHEVKERHEEEIGMYIATQQKIGELSYSISKNKKTAEIMELMKDLTHMFEDQLQHKDAAIKFQEKLNEQENGVLKNKLKRLENKLQTTENIRLIDQKTIYKLESQREISENDNGFNINVIDQETELLSIQAADEILSRLKEKLNKTQDLSTFVAKLDHQITRHKNKIISLN